MKYFLLIATIFSITSSCSKDYSYEGQPLPQNLIEDEKEGLSFFLHTKGAEISVNIHQGTIWVPVTESIKYYEYAVFAGDLQDNIVYTVELQFHSVPATGTFDVMVEGFTAIAGTKSVWIRDIPISVSDAGTKKPILKMTRSGARYSFTRY